MDSELQYRSRLILESRLILKSSLKLVSRVMLKPRIKRKFRLIHSLCVGHGSRLRDTVAGWLKRAPSNVEGAASTLFLCDDYNTL